MSLQQHHKIGKTHTHSAQMILLWGYPCLSCLATNQTNRPCFLYLPEGGIASWPQQMMVSLFVYVWPSWDKSRLWFKRGGKGELGPKVGNVVNLSGNSPFLWALVRPSNPCLIPNLGAAVKWEKLATVPWNWIWVQNICGHSEPAPTRAPWRMNGKWSGNNFLLDSSSLVNHGG